MCNLKRILFCFCCSFLFMLGVRADSLEVFSADLVHGSGLKNSYSDLEIIINMTDYDRNEQRVLLSATDKNIPSSFIVDDGKKDLCTIFTHYENEVQPYISSVDYLKYASMYGDVYLTVYEYDGSVYQKVSNSVLVKRPLLLDYGERILASFYNDESLGLDIRDIYNEESNVKFKIGEVNDSNLLKKVSEYGYADLLEFAKADNNYVKDGTIRLNSASFTDDWGGYHNVWDPSKVVDGKYYYVYFELDDEGGKYYSFDDVALYKASRGDLLLIDYNSIEPDDVKHDKVDITVDSNNKISGTTENPKTGVYSVGIVSIVVLFMVLFFVKRFNLFKKI